MTTSSGCCAMAMHPTPSLAISGACGASLQMMHPRGDFAFVTRPGGLPLQQILEMRRRVLFVPDARYNVFWAEALYRGALDLPPGIVRQLQIRDAAIIGVFAEVAPRARAMQGLCLRHLTRNHEGWILRQEGPIMKGQRTVLELPLSPRVGAILDRYIAVERRDLLQGRDHDALWVAKNGERLGRSGAGIDDRAALEGTLRGQLRPAPVQDQPDDNPGDDRRRPAVRCLPHSRAQPDDVAQTI
jgi:integrase